MTRLRWKVRGVLGLALLLAACGGDGGAERSDLPPGTPLEVEAAPALGLGVLEGDPMQEFDRVVTPFLMPGGEVVVPVAGASVLRIFAPDGRFLRSLGRSGEGPGEFRSIVAAWARGDTIEVHDGRLRRITRFRPDGGVEMVTLQGVPGAQGALPGALPDGWVLTGVAQVDPSGRDQMLVQRFGLDGAHLGEVARLEGMQRYERSGGGSGPTPLSPRALYRLAHGRVYVADALAPSIRILAPGGEPLDTVSWTPSPTVAPDEAFRLVLDSAAARAAPEQAEALRAGLEEAGAPPALPALWDFVVDALGFVWVRPFEPLAHAAALGGLGRGGGGGTWVIFTPEGAPAGSVTLPAGLNPVMVTEDAVLGLHRDELGVESVRIHELRRR